MTLDEFCAVQVATTPLRLVAQAACVVLDLAIDLTEHVNLASASSHGAVCGDPGAPDMPSYPMTIDTALERVRHSVELLTARTVRPDTLDTERVAVEMDSLAQLVPPGSPAAGLATATASVARDLFGGRHPQRAFAAALDIAIMASRRSGLEEDRARQKVCALVATVVHPGR